MSPSLRAIVMVVLVLAGATAPAAPAPPLRATPAPPELVAELYPIIERARQRFEARDASGVLANVSEQYRSGGLTKAGLRDQLLSMFAIYDAMRVRLTIERVQLVDGAVWIYTSGEVSGSLRFVGWMTVLSWQNEPEVARREGAGWRLFGFQD
jgi:integrase